MHKSCVTRTTYRLPGLVLKCLLFIRRLKHAVQEQNMIFDQVSYSIINTSTTDDE